jgi:hypothetical protein
MNRSLWIPVALASLSALAACAPDSAVTEASNVNGNAVETKAYCECVCNALDDQAQLCPVPYQDGACFDVFFDTPVSGAVDCKPYDGVQCAGYGPSSYAAGQLGQCKLFVGTIPQPGQTTSGGGGTCGASPSCDACTSCAMAGACAMSADACAKDPKCGEFDTCYRGCSEQACVTSCADANPDGAAVWSTVMSCLYCDECPMLCEEQTSAFCQGSTGGAQGGTGSAGGGETTGGQGGSSASSGQGGGANGGGGGGGACCSAAEAPGCSDSKVEACVCGLDTFCCDTSWDAQCVDEATSCGGCS